jgi:predicted NAD/FAD-binding protein/DUF1365 family protein
MRRVAVVGSGVSGLVAAHLLSEHSRVTLYETDGRLGGHADTHVVGTPAGPVAIDTGFIVHNERTYPTLVRLFDELGVPTQDSDMSMSVRDETSGLEYAGALGVRGLFPTWRNAADPRFWRMLVEVVRFHRRARAVLAGGGAETTLAEFLDRGRFSAYFRRHFVTPLVSCVWSCDPAVALDYPARYLFTFLAHHGMLAVFGSPTWRTVTGGSQEYVRRVAAGIAEVRLETKVIDVEERDDAVLVTDGGGQVTAYDAVVIATHPDQALAMLNRPTAAQRDVLGAITYSANVGQLHTDESLLPRARAARASWNYQRRTASDEGAGRVLVTYDLSRLMRLPGWDDPDATHYLVTLNGTDLVDPASVLATREYAHPLYTPASVAAQARLPEIDTRRVAFAGAYHGWGFHEDGAASGLRAARHLEPAVRAAADTAARRYRTTIRHTRLGPVRHAFRYRSTHWLVDLDHLPGRGFRAGDHVGDPDRSIRDNVEALLAEHGIELAGGRIRMLAQPRSLGFVFNPLSVFWCDHADGTPAAVVLEVHNTYGGRHAYVVRPDERGRGRVGKELYVSPFNDTSGEYAVAVPSPGERVDVSVTLHRAGQPPFVATLRGGAVPGARPRPSLASHLAALRIRRHGVALWLRRLPVQPRPTTEEDR